jgi:hypothetical protein
VLSQVHLVVRCLGSADAAAAKASLGLAAVASSGSASDITTGTLPSSVMPPLAIYVSRLLLPTQAAMLALTAQRGDVAIRTDTGRSFILATDSPALLWRTGSNSPLQAMLLLSLVVLVQLR